MSDALRMSLSILASGAVLFTFWRSGTVRLTRIQYAVVGTTVITATIHLLAGPGSPWLFLNGMGFLVLLLALYFMQLRQIQPLMAWAMIGYSFLTIVLYFVVHPWSMIFGNVDKLALFTKTVEAILIGLLLAEKCQVLKHIGGDRVQL